MLIRIKKSSDVPSSEITPEHIYRSRRDFMKTALIGAAGAVAGSMVVGEKALRAAEAQGSPLAPLPNVTKSTKYVLDTKVDTRINGYDEITNYNNYYEFSTSKQGVARLVDKFKPRPWTVKVDGLVDKPATYGIEDLIDFNHLEERVYRHRCVEGWSMVMPWSGVSLSDVLNKVKPQSKAKYVEFTTVVRPNEMPGLATGGLDWPYIEGLRMDEAMHPLTMMVVGLYGKVLPAQDGAPLRVHMPWKYGFKSGKSIVRIRLTDTQPQNTWAVANPNEYGFYANVNPNVDHPRWSQKMESRLPSLFKNRPTLMFNGYSEVASLYAGMDLKKFF